MNSDQVRSTIFWRTYKPELLDQARARSERERCPVCQGRYPRFTATGIEGVPDQQVDCVCQVARFEHDEMARITRISGLPRDARIKTLSELTPREGPKWTEMQELIADMAHLSLFPWEHKWIFVHGPKGTGKTHLLMATARYLLPDLAAYIYADELGSRIFRELKAEQLDELIEDLVAVPVLMLDDLGTESTDRNDYVLLQVSNILNRREQEGIYRPTVITTNLNQAEMEARYPRLNSRLWEPDLTHRYVLELSDHRQRGMKQDESSEPVVPEDHTGVRGQI